MVLKVLQRRKSSTSRRQNKEEDPVEQDDIDDAASALELALHESAPQSNGSLVVTQSSVMASAIERTSSSSRAREVDQELRETRDEDGEAADIKPKPDESSQKKAASSKVAKVPKTKEAVSKPKQGTSSKSKKDRVVATTKRKNEESTPKNWIRTFHRGTADSIDATLPPLQITITAALLTGLVATSERSKRLPQKEKETSVATDLVTGYVRIVPSKFLALAPYSPKLCRSLPLSPMVQGMTTAKAGQSFVIWANDDPNDIGSLIVETKASSKEPTITLEIGVVSNDNMLPLGTATFQPGTMEVRDRRRHLKVEKMRSLPSSGLFRKKHTSDSLLGSDYRVGRDSFLSLKVEVKQGERKAPPKPPVTSDEATVPRRRPITPEGLERTFSTASFASEEHSVRQEEGQPDCGVSLLLGFFAGVCCWCFGENAVGSTEKDNENPDDEVASTDAESCGENQSTHKSAQDSTNKGAQTNHCCCYGNDQGSERERLDTDADLTLNQSTGRTEALGSEVETAFDDQTTYKTVEERTVAPTGPLAACCMASGSVLESPPRESDSIDKNIVSVDVSKAAGNDDNIVADVAIDNAQVVSRETGSGGTTCVASVCGACFGDTDVEELQALRLQAEEMKLQSSGDARGDAFSGARSFAETVSTQVARRNFCTTWCGEADVERLLPAEAQKAALPAQSDGDKSQPVVGDPSRESAVGAEKLVVENSQGETIASVSTDDKSSRASSCTRRMDDVLKENRNNSDFSNGYTSYSTSYTSAQIEENAPGTGCFPFMSGIDTGRESASSSYDSSTSGDSLTVFSRLPPDQMSSIAKSDALARASEASLVDVEDQNHSFDSAHPAPVT